MRLENVKVGWGITGSHCMLERVIGVARKLHEEDGVLLTPIMSPSVSKIESRFGDPAKWRRLIGEFYNGKIIETIEEAEPVGPKQLLDVMVVAPCTGNTIAKIAWSIADTPVLMAVKAHLRNNRPVVIAVSTNDGLGGNAKNIGFLLNCKNIFLVPFGQDDPWGKENSLVAKMELLPETIVSALNKKQLQPVLLEY